MKLKYYAANKFATCFTSPSDRLEYIMYRRFCKACKFFDVNKNFVEERLTAYTAFHSKLGTILNSW